MLNLFITYQVVC